VHEDAPVVFESRWAMSYLRGPLTRAQIRTLMAPRAAEAPAAGGQPAAPVPATATTAAPAPAPRAPAAARPVLPPDVPQHVLPRRTGRVEGAALVYVPMLLGIARVRFTDARRAVDATEDVAVVTPVGDEAVPVDWDGARDAGVGLDDLEQEPVEGAAFAPLPLAAGRGKSYEAWTREFTSWVTRSRTLTLWRSPSTGLVSRPGEAERDFRVRLSDAAHEQRDALADKLRKKYAPRIAALQERIRRAEQAVTRETAEAQQSQVQTVISIGATLLGAFLGRKSVSTSTLGRATTAARSAGRVLKDRQDIGRATETVAALQEQLAALEAGFRAEVDAVVGAAAPATEALEPIALRPTRSNVEVRLVALAWAPTWQRPGQPPAPAWT
jgi:hypothetical protein